MTKLTRIEEAAQIGQLEFGYVDWDAELPQTKERWYKVMRKICQLFPQPLPDPKCPKCKGEGYVKEVMELHGMPHIMAVVCECVKPQPLDDKDLRKKIGFAICPENEVDFECCGRCMHYRGDEKCYNPRIDGVLALLQQRKPLDAKGLWDELDEPLWAWKRNEWNIGTVKKLILALLPSIEEAKREERKKAAKQLESRGLYIGRNICR